VSLQGQPRSTKHAPDAGDCRFGTEYFAQYGFEFFLPANSVHTRQRKQSTEKFFDKIKKYNQTGMKFKTACSY
jgi:hypothetical protein